jgi:hypothetical protein
MALPGIPLSMKELRSNAALIGRVFINRYSIFVLNGFLLAATLLFYMQDLYEHGIIGALANNVRKEYSKYQSPDSTLIGGLKLTHLLEDRRRLIFENEEIKENYADFLRPVTYDLMTAKGSCGSYSMVLGSILHELGYKVRFAQMKVGDTWGGHIIIEALTPNGWVVLDPSFNLSFKKPDGKLASFKDVQNNWDYYKQQLPEDYIHEYAYEDVRYTNWQKVPVLSPAMKGVLNFTIGKEATEDLSLRVFFIRKFKILYYISLALYLYSWFIIVRRYTRKRTASKRSVASGMKGKGSRVYQRA